MRDRFSTILLSAFTVASLLVTATPQATRAASLKVAIIVGPTGSQTDSYRDYANREAAAAADAGAEVVKVYSPRATWENVVAAVKDANIVIYHGHGNGFPNPYTTFTLPDGTQCTPNTRRQRCELRDRVNGWGLNKTEDGGNSDGKGLVYCGQEALEGRLTSSDGADQRRYCGGVNSGGIDPAPNFAMIFANACYTPGEGEPGSTTHLKRARARVYNYSEPALKLGAGAYYATDLGATRLVTLLLTERDRTYRWIYKHAGGYDAEARRISSHPSIDGAKIWVQKTDSPWLGNGFWYAFAGFTNRTPGTGSGG